MGSMLWELHASLPAAVLTDDSGHFHPYKALLMLVPLMSVFLGMLFGMRYHTSYTDLDRVLREAGEPGLTPDQLRYLKTVRFLVFTGIGLFVFVMLPFLTFGIGAGSPRWPFVAACIAHTIMSLLLLGAAIADQRTGVTRPWLRSLVALVGVAGTIGAPIAAFSLSQDLLVSP